MAEQIKSFPDKKQLKELNISKPLLYEMLKDLFKKKEKSKVMNNKMVINTYVSPIDSKNLSKQEQRQNHGYREHFDGCQMGGGGGMGEEVRGLRSTNRQSQNSPGEVKYSTGNGAAKELIP